MAGGIEAIRARITTLRADNERLEDEVNDLRSTIAKERAEREQVNLLRFQTTFDFLNDFIDFFYFQAENEIQSLTRKLQLVEEELEKAEERLKNCSGKLQEAESARDMAEQQLRANESTTNQHQDKVSIQRFILVSTKVISFKSRLFF